MQTTTTLANETIVPTGRAWIVCLTASLFFFYEFIQMGMFNSISHELMRDFGINAVQLGTLSATYFYADVAFLLFAGVILDRSSTRKVILSAMALCVGFTCVFALSPNVWVAGISHFVAGIGNAFCLLSCVKLATRWFPSQRLALVMGLMVTIGMSGGVVAQTPFEYLTEMFGWRKTVLIDALLGGFIILLIARLVQDEPDNAGTTLTSSAPLHLSLGTMLLMAAKNKQNWLCGLYTSLINLPIFLLGELWGILYLTQAHHIPREQASYITSMVFIGTIIASPLVGWLSDRIQRRRLPMLIGGVLSLMVISIIIYFPHLSFTPLFILFFLLGIFTSTQIIAYPTITESSPKYLTSTSTALASVLIMGGGAVFQPLFGWLMDLHGDRTIVEGVAVYSANDYVLGMMIMPIAFIVALLAITFIRETYCRTTH